MLSSAQTVLSAPDLKIGDILPSRTVLAAMYYCRQHEYQRPPLSVSSRGHEERTFVEALREARISSRRYEY